eukprot:EG_transcript_12645
MAASAATLQAPADGPPAAALKRRLLQAVAGTGMGRVEGGDLAREVDELVAALGAAQEDFDVATADGPWQLLFTRNGNKAPKSQAALSFNKGFQNFDVGQRTFRNVAELWGRRVCVIADLAYRPHPSKPRRLISEITYAGLHIGWLRIPLPIRATGWLEFVYLDSELRVTKGNRGGLFIHTRPPLDKQGRDTLDDQLSRRHIDLDPRGYFIIRVDAQRQLIEAQHHPNTINDRGLACDPTTGEVLSCKTAGPPVDAVFSGRTAKELGVKIMEQTQPCPVSRFDHALYLGREFQRAQDCLERGVPYVQD